MVPFLASFIAGETDLETFRAALDRRSRKEWDWFGLKGMTGAMFVNLLVRKLWKSAEALRNALRSSLRVPRDTDEAEASIRALLDFLEQRIEAGDASRGDLHPGCAAYFLSACWFVQDETCPVYWESTRYALTLNGAFSASKDLASSYADYRRTWLALQQGLGLDTHALEGLCVYLWKKPQVIVDPPPTTRRTWTFSPGARAEDWDVQVKEGIAACGVGNLGDLSAFASISELREALAEERADGSTPINDGRAGWDLVHTMQKGDIVFAKRGQTVIVGVGVVTSDYVFRPDRTPLSHTRSVAWTYVGEWPFEGKMAVKMLTDVTEYEDFLAKLWKAVGRDEAAVDARLRSMTRGPVPPPPRKMAYGREQALRDLFLDPEVLDAWIALAEDRKNLVLQGPPGTGKTFVADRLARLLVGDDDSDRILRVQFHQSMTYEDFIQGYRPAGTGFELRDGPFLRFCRRAIAEPEQRFVVLIDEINRGNLSRILGELMLLVERDKRSPKWGLSLTYSRPEDPRFWIPDRVFILGTMNTADRSLALVDYALRRRFVFVTVPPAFGHPAFTKRLAEGRVDAVVRAFLPERLDALNVAIRKDPNLGPGFEIGHSYFCDPPEGAGESWYRQVVLHEVAPLLHEYWYDDPKRARIAIENLLGEA